MLGRRTRHGLSGHFPCQAGPESTTFLAGRASPRPASMSPNAAAAASRRREGGHRVTKEGARGRRVAKEEGGSSRPPRLRCGCAGGLEKEDAGDRWCGGRGRVAAVGGAGVLDPRRRHRWRRGHDCDACPRKLSAALGMRMREHSRSHEMGMREVRRGDAEQSRR